MNLLAYTVLFFLFLTASAFFSGTETSLFSLSRSQRNKFKSKNSLAAKYVTDALSRPEETLVVILIGSAFSDVCLSVVGATILDYIIELDVGTDSIISILVITPILIIFGDVMPKSIAIHFTRFLAPIVVFPLSAFSKIISPIRQTLGWLANKICMLFGDPVQKSLPVVMEEEFRSMVDLGEKEGAIEREEKELIHNVFDFTDTFVKEVMVPVKDLFSLPVDISYDEMISRLSSVRFSRIPIYEGGPNNIIGVLNVRDIFAYCEKKNEFQDHNIRDWLNPPIFVGPDDKIERLLKDFQLTHLHMAVVRSGNEIKGIVTIEDILDMIFKI